MLKSLCSCYCQKPFAGNILRENGSKMFLKTFSSSTKVCKVPPFQLEASLKGSPLFQQTRLFSSSYLLQIKQIPLAIYSPKRCFRTSSPRNALPPLIVVILGRLAKFGAVFAGRFARRWWYKLPPERKTELTGRASKHRNLLWGVLGGISFGAYIYYDTHIQETPITKRKRFVAFNDDQFNEIAKQQLQLLLEEHKKEIVPANIGQPIYQRVVRVAQRLLNANLDLNQIHNKEWTITVVKDDDVLNAFVLPCGSIFVFSGLLKLCETDDQLGVILGHEMAHAVLAHGSEQASFLHLMDLLFIIPLAALWALIPTDAIAALSHWFVGNMTEILVNLPYNRSLETEADEVGLVLAAKACFDVREAPVVWAKMALWGQMEGHPDIEWLSTHPSSENRQAQLEELLPEAIKTRDACKCPKLPFFDPRLQIEMIKKRSTVAPARPREELLIPLKI